jgi:hypothetical protein
VDGDVRLRDGTLKPVTNLKKGDVVQSEAGFSTIEEVRQMYANAQVCKINEMRITHKHPIKIDGEWCMPKTVAFETREDYAGVMFNFVMRGSPEEKEKHTIVVNDIVCATLGCAPCPKLAAENPMADDLYGSGFWKSEERS